MLKGTYLDLYYSTVVNNSETGTSIMAENLQLFQLLRMKENH